MDSKHKKEQQARRKPSPIMGRNSLMFPVRFPSMICQWNTSWGRECQNPQCPPQFFPHRKTRMPSEKAPIFHSPFATEGWVSQPSARWLPLQGIGGKPGR